MGHLTRLRKVGGSVMLAIPPALLDALRLDAGASVGIAIADGKLLIEPTPKRRYSLDELLAQCNPEIAAGADEAEWLESPRAGAELI